MQAELNRVIRTFSGTQEGEALRDSFEERLTRLVQALNADLAELKACAASVELTPLPDIQETYPDVEQRRKDLNDLKAHRHNEGFEAKFMSWVPEYKEMLKEHVDTENYGQLMETTGDEALTQMKNELNMIQQSPIDIVKKTNVAVAKVKERQQKCYDTQMTHKEAWHRQQQRAELKAECETFVQNLFRPTVG